MTIGEGLTGDAKRTRADSTLEGAASARGYRLFVIRLLNYSTNYVIRRFPSVSVRRLWYRRVLGFELGPNVGIHLGCYVWFYSPRQIRREGVRIGANTRINRDCCLDVRGPVRIGDNVSISPEVMLLTAAHLIDDPAFRVETRPVVIEDHVYIGARAMIMPGVTLGRGCVVAAGAVVTRDVEPLAVVAGVPAKHIGSRSVDALQYTLDTPFPLFE